MNRIIKKWQLMPKKTKKIIATSIAAITIGVGLKGCTEIKDISKNNVYLVDIDDDYENNLELFDENGQNIDIKTSNANELLAIVNKENTKDNEKYQAILINKAGEMQIGYLDGKYLDNKAIDKIKVDENFLNEENNEVNIVDAKNGAWLREEKKVDRDSENAQYLEQGVNVLSTNVSETSKYNSYRWKEAIYYNPEENKLQVGYVADEYLISTNYDEIKGEKFNVNVGNLTLKLRKCASTDSQIIEELENGVEVILLPSIQSISDDKYDWFYVACKIDDEIKFGYVAATYYKEDGTVINYLTNEELEQTKKESNHLQLVVDTSSANYNNLKLREEAGLDGKIIAELVDGTTIWTNKEQLDFDNSLEENDGHKWLRVELTDGQSGYVAMDYVKEKQQEKKEETKTKSDSTVTINFAPKSSEYEDNQTGYLGIDVDIITDAAAFEELLKNGVDYSKSDWVSNNDKKIPNFVYLKCGASNFTSRKINTTQSSKTIEYRNNLERLVKLCEQYKIPYGFYYFSQAINEQDIKTEANFIKKELNDYNTTYNILPFAIDIEEQAKEGDISYYTRVHNNAQNKGKNYQTNITNELINRVREENPNFDFILYTDHNTLASSLNYSEFDEKNKQNPWIVDSTKTHAENLATHDKAAISNASIRQIAIEKKDPDSGIKIDMDFIDKEYFEKILKDHGFEISKKDKDQKLASNNNDYKYTYKPNNDVLLPSGGHLKYKDGEYIVIPPEKETNKSKTLSLS